jgi:hypothetical protein
MARIDQSGKSKEKKQKRMVKLSSNILESPEDKAFVDLEEIGDNRKKGRKMNPLLKIVSKRCARIDDKEKVLVRCLGSAGCKTTWASPRNMQRIFDHAVNCTWLASLVGGVVSQIRTLLAKKAIGPTEELLTDLDTHMSLNPTSGHNSDPENSAQLISGQEGTLPLEKPPVVKKGGLDLYFGGVKQMKVKEHGDYHLLRLLVCNGIPIRIADSSELRDFSMTLNKDYQPPSSTTFRDRLIPNEAAKLQVKTTRYLSKFRHLTLSFDGGRIRRPKGVYTVHVTTPERRPFLQQLSNTSRVSHTADYLTEILFPVCFLSYRYRL